MHLTAKDNKRLASSSFCALGEDGILRTLVEAAARCGRPRGAVPVGRSLNALTCLKQISENQSWLRTGRCGDAHQNTKCPIDGIGPMLHLIKHMQAPLGSVPFRKGSLSSKPKSRLVFWTSRQQADCADNAAIGALAAAATE
jgi:hypothetical protein